MHLPNHQQIVVKVHSSKKLFLIFSSSKKKPLTISRAKRAKSSAGYKSKWKKIIIFLLNFLSSLLSLKLNFYFIFCLTLLPPLFDILPEKIITNRLLSLLLFLFYVKFYFPIQTRSSPRLPHKNFLLLRRKKKIIVYRLFYLLFFCSRHKNLMLLKLSIVDQIIVHTIQFYSLPLVTLMMRIMVEGVNMH